MKCNNCGNKSNLRELKLKELPKGIKAYVCPRCWYIQLELTSAYKAQLIKTWSKQELKKIKK